MSNIVETGDDFIQFYKTQSEWLASSEPTERPNLQDENVNLQGKNHVRPTRTHVVKSYETFLGNAHYFNLRNYNKFAASEHQ
jgi:hypothetical protein